jgi:hypothetical protein
MCRSNYSVKLRSRHNDQSQAIELNLRLDTPAATATGRSYMCQGAAGFKAVILRLRLRGRELNPEEVGE